MNVYEKLNTVRIKLQSKNLKKSGKNTFANYSYYELSDFLPTVNQLMHEHKLCSMVSFDEDIATMTIVDTEKPESKIFITSPMGGANLKGCHDVQNVGAVQSYQRRYLYMAAMEICEADQLDATTGKAESTMAANPKAPPAKPRENTAQPPRKPEQPTDDIEIRLDPDESISSKQVGLIRGKLDRRGIDPDAWKQHVGIDHISEISWRCLNDFKGQRGLITQIDEGAFDSLAADVPPAPAQHDQEPDPEPPADYDIDLDSDDPFRDEEF